ncbi:MAG: DUF6951 family protein [Dissulfuribacterales bacterium]
MTEIVVDAGICGFRTKIKVNSISKKKVSVTIVSDCEMVTMAGNRLKEVDWREIFRPEGCLALLSSALMCIKHPSCPVMTGVFKAIEVETGMALPKDVSIRFVQGD